MRTIRQVQFWELDRLRVAEHQPQVLLADQPASRVIALLLPRGESLQEHKGPGHAFVFVTRGLLSVRTGARERMLPSLSLIHFEPRELHEAHAITECQLMLWLMSSTADA